jgi:O-antigen/teichoic acid export membrane protein
MQPNSTGTSLPTGSGDLTEGTPGTEIPFAIPGDLLPTHMEEGGGQESVADRAVGAGQWRAASSVLQAALQFGITIALARLLPPRDFGLAALGAVIVGLATGLLDLGLGAALVQVQPLSERYIRASFTFAVATGAVLSVAVFASAPWMGVLLRNEMLPPVLRVEAPLFLLAGLGVTARALLQRRLAFKQIGLIELASYVLGYALTSIVLALMGYGVWSLVAGAVVQSLMANLLVLRTVRHTLRPLRPGREVRQLLRFGSGGTLNSGFGQVALYGDNLIVGRYLGTQALGLYARAFSLMILPVGQVGNTIFSVLFPSLSKLREDPKKFANAYLMSVALITLIIAPVMAGMVVAAPHLISGLYGPAWAAATTPLQIFCAVGLFRVAVLPAGAVNLAAGQVYGELRRQIVYAAWVLLGALAGTPWGVSGVAVGVATAILYKYVAMVGLSLRLSQLRWGEICKAQAPGVFLAGLVALGSLLVRFLMEGAGASHLMTFIAMAGVCAGIVPIGLRLLPSSLRPVNLFDRIARSSAPLPGLVRVPVLWALRLDA